MFGSKLYRLCDSKEEGEVVESYRMFHCDPVCNKAMKNYCKHSKALANQDGHFIRRSQNVKSFLISGAVDAMVKKQPKLSVMME